MQRKNSATALVWRNPEIWLLGGDGQNPIGLSGGDTQKGLHTVRTVEAVLESAREGTVVSLD